MQVLEANTLPANISEGISMRQMIQEKIESLTEQEKKIKSAKKILIDALDKNDALFLELHKENGDFEVGGFTVKKSTSWSTVVLDESKLPKECFTYKPTISLSTVKELILEGKIPREVAIQQKNESVKIK